MCGFVGCFQDGGKPVPDGVIERMLAAIRHRGPDDEGTCAMSFAGGIAAEVRAGTARPTGCDAGFGFARLSIQDLSQAGHQPMFSADDRIVLVFNGEIYNAGAHRDALRHLGAVFRGRSDTEVILRLYERYGWEGMLERIEGMFAIAIADMNLGSLFVARDHFGIKPLYWWRRNGTLLLASEPKAFLAHPDYQAELEPDHLAEQLMFRYCAWDRTLLRGVHQLPPGHCLRWRPGAGLEIQRYWSLPDSETAATGSAEALADGVDEALKAAVQCQLVSDVPLGTQLSGGIDSSLITLEAARASSVDLHAFSIVFSDPRYSEEHWIDRAAAVAGVHSHRYLFTSTHFAEDFGRVTWHLDAPPGNPNTLALNLLAAHARHSVKVMLTGEGCDELFAGYNRFFYAGLQGSHSRLFSLAAHLGKGMKGKLYRLLGQPGQSMEHHIVLGSAYGAAGWVREMAPDARPESAIDQRLAHLNAISGQGVFRHIRYEAETYLPDLLLRQDKMTMAHGVECRVPFLDLKLARIARCLPADSLSRPVYGKNARMRGTKRVIKRLATRAFGAPFAFRQKKGFDVPLNDFFRQGATRQRLQDEWLPAMKRRGLLAPKAIDGIWRQIERDDQTGGAAEALWVALGLEVWAGQSLDASSPNSYNSYK